jgi:hypothetical protein
VRPLVVFYLVREIEGIAPLARFLRGYATNEAGTSHSLVVLLKGYRPGSLPPEGSALLRAHRAEQIFVPEGGFDIGSYCRGARACSADCYCFLNSHSEPLQPGWLRHLHTVLGRPGVGVVGATGSYETPPLVFEVAPWLARIRGYRRLRLLLAKRQIPPFPNAHLRTNALMLSASVWRRIRPWPLKTKFDAYLFEGGRRGLTAQVRAMGLATLVVGADGRGYTPPEWPASRVFRSGRQENLLVGDNHTRLYAAADSATQERLRLAAWGGRAEPWAVSPPSYV